MELISTHIRNRTEIHQADDIAIGDFQPGDALVFNTSMNGLVPLRSPASLEGLSDGVIPYVSGGALAESRVRVDAFGNIMVGPADNGRRIRIDPGSGEIGSPEAVLYLQRSSPYGVIAENYLMVYGPANVGIAGWAPSHDHLYIGTESSGPKITFWDRDSSNGLRRSAIFSTGFQAGADGPLDFLGIQDTLVADYAAPTGRLAMRHEATGSGTKTTIYDALDLPFLTDGVVPKVSGGTLIDSGITTNTSSNPWFNFGGLTGGSSIAIMGDASAGRACAVGQNSDAAFESAAFGHVANAAGFKSVAIGAKSQAAYSASGAIGNGAAAVKANQYMLGNPNIGEVATHGSIAQYAQDDALTSQLVIEIDHSLSPSGALDYLGQLDEKIASYAAPTGRIFHRINATPTGTVQAFGDVVGGNTVGFEETGFVKFSGSARPTDDLLPLAVSLGFGSAQPDFSVYYGNMRGWEFVGTGVMKEIQVSFQTRHGREDGSDVGPHLHIYIPDDATGGDIKFFIEWHWDNVWDTGAPTVSTSTHTISRTPSEGISRNHIVSFGDFVGTGMGISSILTCRVYRDPTDGGDTFGSSIWLRSIDAHAIDDTLGSRSTFVK